MTVSRSLLPFFHDRVPGVDLGVGAASNKLDDANEGYSAKVADA